VRVAFLPNTASGWVCTEIEDVQSGTVGNAQQSPDLVKGCALLGEPDGEI